MHFEKVNGIAVEFFPLLCVLLVDHCREPLWESICIFEYNFELHLVELLRYERIGGDLKFDGSDYIL